MDDETEKRLRALGDNWGSYKGVPITDEAIATAKSLQFVPLSRGGIQIEMMDGNLEIVIEPSGRVGGVYVVLVDD